MEYRYTLTDTRAWYNDTCVIPKVTHFTTKNDKIVIADGRIASYAIGKNVDVFLTQLFVWGNQFSIEIELIGISEVVKLFSRIENLFTNTKYLQLWTGSGFTYFAYTNEKEKQRILENTKDLFVPEKNHRATIPLITPPKEKKVIKQFVLNL